MNFVQKMLKMRRYLYSPEGSINSGSTDKGDSETSTNRVDVMTQRLVKESSEQIKMLSVMNVKNQ
ncbi:hypothetical protein A2U01_0075646, partial [Trifolium medium]|nr:hypothetical protein [Trifolium medium]